ncbi:MAG: radical SAM protein [Candidatus Gracilibacteria bacterium]|nr:radical SAM protein [Candidatus Gracilibacteria bacterium]
MKDQRVHILTSGGCTNNCVFCMDDKTLRNFIGLEKLRSDLIKGLDYSNEVTFTSGEPTIHPKIVEMIRIAKDLGYRTIQIISNGRKYKDINFLLDLINAGVTDFIISIHGYNSRLHDSIVRKKGALDDVLKGIINISKLKKKYNLVFNTNTTIIRQNYKEVYKIVYFLEKFPIDSIVLNVVIPQEEAYKNKDDILVKYSLIAKEFSKINILQDKFKNIYINGFPYCLGNNLVSMIGFREPVFFEQDGINFARHSENHSLESSGKIDLEMINGKVKGEKCNGCKYFSDCEGIWKSYINIFGWEEFLAVK